uniref:Uncharacterized protein n=1 Tax=Myotis myotis TaxID=51298 RepID=A0A7J7XZZ1_MYOMY|nr:hypothetical protein mMyoMyo1_011333 [Myotis myotis]
MGRRLASPLPRASLRRCTDFASSGSGFRGRRKSGSRRKLVLPRCVREPPRGSGAPGTPSAGPHADPISPALAGSAFTSSPFPRFVPGCSRSELGFNFPAPAASRGSPEGGAESERWKRKKRGC